MVGLTYICDNSEQLNLVQETYQELKFQFDKHRRAEAAIKKRTNWIKILISTASVLFFAWHFSKANTILIGDGKFFFTALIPLIGVSLLSFLIFAYLSPYSAIWFFDSSNRQLRQTTHKLFWGKSTHSFSFDAIQDVIVDKAEARDNEYCICTYIYIVLVTGKAIKLSQSGYFTDARAKAIALKHHQDIARKMRERIGLKNSDEAHEIYIPSEAEVAEERDAAFRTTKELFSSIFSTKSEKASNLGKLKLTTAQNPHDAQSWEQLALIYIQDKYSIQDGIKAYRQAEMLYREQGNTSKADLIRSMLKRLKTS